MGQHADALARARQRLADADREIALGLGSAAGALRVARTRQAADVARAVDAARQILASGRCEAHDGWSSGRWTQWRPGYRVPAELRIGEIEVGGGVLPATVPLFDGAAVVLASEGAQAVDHAHAALRGLAVRCGAALGRSADLHLIDPYQEGFGFPERRDLGVAPLGRDVAADLDVVVNRARDVAAGGDARPQVVLVMDYPRGYGYREVALINRLARLAPAGVQLIIHHDLDADLPGGQQLDLAGPCVVRVGNDGIATGPWGGLAARLDPPAPSALVAGLATHLRQPEERAQSTVIDWAELHQRYPTEWWRGDASIEVRATIGRQGDGAPLTLTLGQDAANESRAHMVVGGDTGAGKSVLLRTFITSLASTYHPNELRFWLIDGQNGAGLSRYRRLPHADLVALDAPVDIVRAMLIDIDTELTRRSSLLAAAQVDGITGYRRRYPGEMPRLVVIIDEYQQLFTDDDRQETARILQRITALGRKAGVHLVLSSQRFEATGLHNQNALFANIRTRVALRMPTDSIDGIDEFEREGRALIRSHCTAVGQVVANAEGGRDGMNHHGRVALLADDEETGIVADLAAKMGPGAATPVLVDGKEQPDPSENRALAALARLDTASWAAIVGWAQSAPRDGGLRAPSWHAYDGPIPFIVGRSLSVYGSTYAAIERKPGGNVLVVADNPEVLTGTILTGLACVAMATPRAQLTMSVLAEHPPGGGWAGMLTTRLVTLAAGRGHSVAWADTDAGAVDLLTKASAELDWRSSLSANARAELGPHLVVAVGLDRLVSFRLEDGRYELTASAATATLLRLAKEGPDVGIHLVLGFTSRAAWDQVMPARSARRFDHRIVRQMSEPDSTALLDSTFGNRVNAALRDGQVIGPDRAGYSHRATGQESVFLPYRADEGLYTTLTRCLAGGPV